MLLECEREMVYRQSGPLTVPQGQLDHSLTLEEKFPLMRQEKVEPQQKLEEASNLQEQVGLYLSLSVHTVFTRIRDDSDLRRPSQIKHVRRGKVYLS
jgi:hypothetical protein